jgi:hypothetical protein
MKISSGFMEAVVRKKFERGVCGGENKKIREVGEGLFWPTRTSRARGYTGSGTPLLPFPVTRKTREEKPRDALETRLTNPIDAHLCTHLDTLKSKYGQISLSWDADCGHEESLWLLPHGVL